MQTILLNTIGNTLGNTIGPTLGTTISITPILNTITTLSSSIFGLLTHIKLTKHSNDNEIIQMLNKADIEATITLLQHIIIEVSKKESLANNSFIIIALQHVKDSIAEIESELKVIKERITYNMSLYLLVSLRSYNLLLNMNAIEAKISILDRRCEYLFKSLELSTHLLP